jgi:hypothetical protein
MRDAARRGARENVDPARDPDTDSALADAEEAGEEVVERNPDPLSSREAFEREIAERGESEEGAEIGTLTDPDDRAAIEQPPADQR